MRIKLLIILSLLYSSFIYSQVTDEFLYSPVIVNLDSMAKLAYEEPTICFIIVNTFDTSIEFSKKRNFNEQILFALRYIKTSDVRLKGKLFSYHFVEATGKGVCSISPNFVQLKSEKTNDGYISFPTSPPFIMLCMPSGQERDSMISNSSFRHWSLDDRFLISNNFNDISGLFYDLNDLAKLQASSRFNELDSRVKKIWNEISKKNNSIDITMSLGKVNGLTSHFPVKIEQSGFQEINASYLFNHELSSFIFGYGIGASIFDYHFEVFSGEGLRDSLKYRDENNHLYDFVRVYYYNNLKESYSYSGIRTSIKFLLQRKILRQSELYLTIRPEFGVNYLYKSSYLPQEGVINTADYYPYYHNDTMFSQQIPFGFKRVESKCQDMYFSIGFPISLTYGLSNNLQIEIGFSNLFSLTKILDLNDHKVSSIDRMNSSGVLMQGSYLQPTSFGFHFGLKYLIKNKL